MKRMIITGGTVVTPFEEIEADVLIEGGRIARVEPGIVADGADVIDAAGRIVAPGATDLHIQGHEGRDFWECSYEAANHISLAMPPHGVTGIVPTTDGEVETLSAVAEAIGRGVDGAPFLGIHSEGPFVSPERLGAIGEGKARPVEIDRLKRLLDAGGGNIRIMTIAPEIPGALEAIEFLAESGVCPSLGHSQASFEEAAAGFDAGARRVTHLFNAMTSFADRDDGGLAGAALLCEGIFVEMVCDCVHVHPAIMRLAARARGVHQTAAVTDSVKVAGMPPGRYESGGHGYRITVERQGQPPRLDDGTIAGSALSMDQAVRNLVDTAGFSLAEAFTMAAFVPAATLGIESQKGRIAPGFDADIVIYSQALEVEATYIGGERAFSRAP